MSKEQTMPYCLAPWVHSYISMHGERRLCCFAGPTEKNTDSIDTDFQDFWNGPYLKEVRKKMLAGECPAECARCSEKPNASTRMVRLPKSTFNNYFADVREVALKNTDLSGAFAGQPLSFDYRLSADCNFTCRMCNSSFSSSIRRLEKMAGISAPKPIDKTNVIAELKKFLLAGVVRKLYFADGEPFLSKGHWEIITYAIDFGFAPLINLEYNSNLSISSYRNQPLAYWLKKFKSVALSASLETVGKEGEFIRDGLSWELWQKNFEELRTALPQGSVGFAITLTLPVLLDLSSLFDFLEKYPLDYTLGLPISNGSDLLLSPLALDRKTLKPILNSARGNLGIRANPHLKQFKDTLSLLESSVLLPEANPRWTELLLEYVNYFQAIDPFRKSISTNDWFFSKKRLRGWYVEIKKTTYSSHLIKHHLNYAVAEPILISNEINKNLQTIFAEQGRNFLSLPAYLCFSHNFKNLSNCLETLTWLEPLLPVGSRISILGSVDSVFRRLLNMGQKYSALPLLSVALNKHTWPTYNQFHIIKAELLPLEKKILFKKYPLIMPLADSVLGFLWRVFPRIFSIHQQIVLEKQS